MTCTLHKWVKNDQGAWVCDECGKPYLGPEPVARKTDPDTSWDATASVSDVKMTRVRQGIYDLLVDFGPMTDEEIWRGLAHRQLEAETSPSGARTRRSELVAANRVYDTGNRKKGKTNRKMILWAARKEH